jgi:hypothetical protein
MGDTGKYGWKDLKVLISSVNKRGYQNGSLFFMNFDILPAMITKAQLTCKCRNTLLANRIHLHT